MYHARLQHIQLSKTKMGLINTLRPSRFQPKAGPTNKKGGHFWWPPLKSDVIPRRSGHRAHVMIDEPLRFFFFGVGLVIFFFWGGGVGPQAIPTAE